MQISRTEFKKKYKVVTDERKVPWENTISYFSNTRGGNLLEQPKETKEEKRKRIQRTKKGMEVKKAMQETSKWVKKGKMKTMNHYFK